MAAVVAVDAAAGRRAPEMMGFRRLLLLLRFSQNGCHDAPKTAGVSVFFFDGIGGCGRRVLMMVARRSRG